MIKVIVSRDMQENCYCIIKGDHCVVIDPGCRADDVISFINQSDLTLSAILLTHGHFDHIRGVDGLVDYYHCPVYGHPLTAAFVKDDALTLGTKVKAPVNDFGESMTIDGMHFDYFYTPGHTHDSGLYYYQEEHALFTGDTLFQGSIGRYDLPTANVEELISSLKKIASFDFDADVYPGHGPSTTIRDEQTYNPYLRQIKDYR